MVVHRPYAPGRFYAIRVWTVKLSRSSLNHVLRGDAISEGNNAPMAKFIANTHEVIWRERCRQWIKAEHPDDPPYLA